MDEPESTPRRTRAGWQYAAAAAAGLALFAFFFWPRDEAAPPGATTAAGTAATGAAGDFATEVDLGLAALGRGDNETAIRHFNAAITASPQSPVGYLDLCIAQLRAGKYLESMPGCEKAAAMAPENLDARHNLGYANRMIGRHAVAIELLEEVVAKDAGRAVSWYELGMAQLAAGRPGPARASFERTLAVDPNHGAARLRLAELQAAPAASPAP